MNCDESLIFFYQKSSAEYAVETVESVPHKAHKSAFESVFVVVTPTVVHIGFVKFGTKALKEKVGELFCAHFRVNLEVCPIFQQRKHLV